MRRFLGILVLLLTLSACGGEGDDRADDPASSSDGGDAEVVAIVSGSAAGGEVAAEATPITDDGDLVGYLRQFDSPAFVADLSASVAAHRPGDGRVVGLAVIAIGCDVPPSATVTLEEDGAYVVTPGKVVAPHQECLVPVTSVAVLDLPA